MNDKIMINDTEYAVPFAVSGMLKVQTEQIEQLQSENARLKEALEECIEQFDGHYQCSKTSLDGCSRCDALEKANQALKGQDNEHS